MEVGTKPVQDVDNLGQNFGNLDNSEETAEGVRLAGARLN